MKDFLNHLEFKIYKTRWVILLVLLVVGILFHSLIEEWFNDKIVSPYLSHIHRSPQKDTLLIIIAMLVLAIGINRIVRNYIVGSFNVIVYTIGFLTYIYYRNFTTLYIFEPFHSISYFYSDVIGLIFLVGIFLWARNFEWLNATIDWIKNKTSKAAPNTYVTPFILDEPLAPKGIDELNRREDAVELCKKLIATKSEKAIAIGINGEWGSGKSSFFQMIKDELNKSNNSLIIDFNPWRGYKENALYEDFFSALSESIGKHGDLLKSDLKRYGETLLSSKEGIIESVVSFGSNLFSVDSIEEQHREINETLKRINKNFFVFVDDLDRLSSSEIVDIIKLIRNTADFHNLKFLLAYDKNYLMNAIKSFNYYNYEAYLEKIILYEHTLLPIQTSSIEKSLETIFVKYALPEVRDEFKKVNRVGNYERGTHIYRFVFNLRDVKRFSNKFISAYNLRYKEVEIVDFINFELLRFKYPSLVKFLYYKESDYFVVDDKGIKTLRISEGKKDEYIIYKYINENIDYLQIEKANKDSLFTLLSGLFGTPHRVFDTRLSDKSIKRSKNFDSYFRETTPEDGISHQNFEKLLLGNVADIKVDLVSFVKGKKRKAIVDKFENFNPLKQCNSQEQFEKVIEAIFYLGNIPEESGEDYYGYPDRNIFEKLYDKKEISNKFYSGNQDRYKQFIIRLLDEAQSPFFNEAGFLNFLSDSLLSEIDFIIPQTEIEFYLIKYFRNYCDTEIEFTRVFWSLFHNCTKRINIDSNTSRREYLEEAKIIHSEFSFKNSAILKRYLENITEKEMRNEKGFAISQTVKIVHGEFQTFIDKLNASKYTKMAFVKEFQAFYEVFKASAYNLYVPFDFKYLFK